MSKQHRPTPLSNDSLMPQTLRLSDDAELRMMSADDAPAAARHINGDPVVRDSIGWVNGIVGNQQTAEHIVSRPDEGIFEYGFYVDDRIVGLIGMSERRDSNLGGEFSFGYSLDREYRGRGLASKGLKVLMEAALTGGLAPECFTLYISDANPKSRAVARRNGFMPTESFFYNDKDKIERRYVRKAV